MVGNLVDGFEFIGLSIDLQKPSRSGRTVVEHPPLSDKVRCSNPPRY